MRGVPHLSDKGSSGFSLRGSTQYHEAQFLPLYSGSQRDLFQSGSKHYTLLGLVGNRVRIGPVTNPEASTFMALTEGPSLVWVVVAEIP